MMNVFRLTFVLLALFAMMAPGVHGRHATTRKLGMSTQVPDATKVPKGLRNAQSMEPRASKAGRRGLHKNGAVRRNVQEQHSLVGKRTTNAIQGGMRLK